MRGTNGDVWKLSTVGEVIGESILPMVTHKGNTFALVETTMLALDMVNRHL